MSPNTTSMAAPNGVPLKGGGVDIVQHYDLNGGAKRACSTGGRMGE